MVVLVFTHQEIGTKMSLTESTTPATRKISKSDFLSPPKAFEQAAGFLRIRDGASPLDASAVHPESYAVVETMARDTACTPADLMREPHLLKRIEPSRHVTAGSGTSDPEQHPRRTRKTGPRFPECVRALLVRSGNRKGGGSRARHEAPRDRHQCGGLRRFWGHRRAPGRHGPRERALGQFRERPGAGGARPPAGQRHRFGGGPGKKPHCTPHEDILCPKNRTGED